MAIFNSYVKLPEGIQRSNRILVLLSIFKECCAEIPKKVNGYHQQVGFEVKPL